ncbi:hypothetical protein A1O3_00946 [Capronia epimyces CBS 606.96]|uniref:Uncharacterized protein n=1 Tax=Capronia epimyces CBS 606.96 TaxID=1182542 RepID=W9YT31_9EURO|nr:uncharacterized protein A1O3_00946 [Capronia epimyces CBS 606.96]EXJ92396.1 hypothetical protein A1O3_00946 [Capronia epimyces CBS 606.96]
MSLCLLNLAICVALSPAQVFLFKQKGSYRSAKPMDQFGPNCAPDSPSSVPISVDIVAVHGLGLSPDTAWAYKLKDAPQSGTTDEALTQSWTTPGLDSKIGPIWFRDFLPLKELQTRKLGLFGSETSSLSRSSRLEFWSITTTLDGKRMHRACL